MEGLFENFGGFLNGDLQVETDVAENLGYYYGADHMMPITEMGSFSDGVAPELLDQPDWDILFSDLYFPDYFQGNDCLIDQHIHGNETQTVQVQAEYGHEGNQQPRSSASIIPLLPRNIDGNVLFGTDNDDDLVNIGGSTPEQHHQEPLGPEERRSEIQEPQDDALLGTTEGDVSVKEVAITEKNKNICSGDSDDENDENEDEDDKIICKNLMSERNRRKRLNKLLLTLRSMIPKISKMDKRSVLVDALSYLQGILDQTKIEIENQNSIFAADAAAGTTDLVHVVVGTQRQPDSSTVNVEINHAPLHAKSGVVLLEKNAVNVNVEAGQPQQIMSATILEPSVLHDERCAIFPTITKIEAEKVDEERFVLKIVHNKAMGAMGQVQRAVDMLNGFHCINVSVSEYDQHHMQSTNFLRAKKTKGSLLVTDEEKSLIDKVKTAAKQMGVLLCPDPSSV